MISTENKEVLQIVEKGTNSPIEKWTNHMSRHLTEEEKNEQDLNIIRDQRNEIPIKIQLIEKS